MIRVSELFEVAEVLGKQKWFFQITFERGADVNDVLRELTCIKGISLSGQGQFPAQMKFLRPDGSRGAFTHWATFRAEHLSVYLKAKHIAIQTA